MMQNIIRIRKATFYGYHGVRSEEQSVGGKFEADVDIYTDFTDAAREDNLNKTIDYHEVYSFMYHLALEQKYYLIESLAGKIAEELLLKFDRISKVAVRVRKNNPPLGGVVDCVEVEVVKERTEIIQKCHTKIRKEKIKNLAYIGIGSNKGNRTDYLISAIDMIDSDPESEVVTVSSVYETKPFGYIKQDNFLNAVAKITTNYSPINLFKHLKKIENKLGRQTEIEWGPREIDLDILFFNDLIYSDENITIPHKGITDRDFVLIPLSEIEPDLIHPVAGKKLYELELPDSGSNIIRKFDINILVK